MMFETIEVVRGSRVAVIWLNRPEVHNALNEVMVKELTQAIDASAHDAQVNAIVLASRGDSFCSGTDLNWYRSVLDGESGSVEAMAVALAGLLKAIEASPIPVIARVNGHCVGAGVGLVAAADIAVSSHDAEFTQPETGLGLTPHLVAPYLSRAIGVRSASRWLMTGETFGAAEAWRLGLTHEICDVSELDARINGILGHLMTAELGAVKATRTLLKSLSENDTTAFDPALAKEGVSAFLEKRWPSWAPDELK
jgi:methylglutaconyl-CoA hydratase